MDVLVTGGDTDLGRTIATAFRDAGHTVVLAGARRAELEVAAKELDAEALEFDNTNPASVEAARPRLSHHLDTVVNVPVLPEPVDPRTATPAELAAGWRAALDAVVLSAVLTVHIAGDHIRSGGSIVNVLPDQPKAGTAGAAIKAALADWTAGQATYYGTRGITINLVAAGNTFEPGYDGLLPEPRTVAEEIARTALFITTPAARHINGQTLHVSRGVPAYLR